MYLSRETQILENLNKKPNWHITKTSECTTECGGGWQYTQVECLPDSKNCQPYLHPVALEACNTNPCN